MNIYSVIIGTWCVCVLVPVNIPIIAWARWDWLVKGKIKFVKQVNANQPWR